MFDDDDDLCRKREDQDIRKCLLLKEDFSSKMLNNVFEALN